MKPNNQIELVEQAIVEKLRESLPERIQSVCAFSYAPEKFDFEGFQAACLVRFNGSTFLGDDSSAARVYAPHRQMSWQVIVLTRSLAGAQEGIIGAYEVLEAVRLALQGQSLSGATPLKIMSDRLDEEFEKGARWIVEFTHTMPAIARLKAEF